jgi:uncharacterized protein YcbX
LPTEIGTVEALFRYPVKSMRGEPLQAATLGVSGLEGDRRLALRRLDPTGEPLWLTASKLPELVLFTPRRAPSLGSEALPSHVLTPQGDELPVFGDALAAEIARRLGSPVQMTHREQGIFDDGAISVITTETVRELSRRAETPADLRRFRPNIVVRSTGAAPFEEDEWLGAVLAFGAAEGAPAVTVTKRDVRCVMVNIDPDEGRTTPEMLKAVVRANQNCAGVYGSVTRLGPLAVGQRVFLLYR